MITIITITKNDPHGLLRTEASIARFQLTNTDLFEWVVVYSGSSPKFRSLKPDRCVKSHRNGVYHAMNVGINNATNPKVWMLNGGDEILSVDKEKLTVELQKDQEAWYFGDQIDARGAVIQRNCIQSMAKTGKIAVCHQAIILPRTLLYNEKMKIHGDLDLAIRAYEKFGEPVNVALSVFKDNLGISSKKNNLNSLIERMCICLKYAGIHSSTKMLISILQRKLNEIYL